MPRPFRECVAFYIGGGWGKEVEDDQHTAIARVIRGTDIPDARLNIADSFPVRFHKPSNARSRLLRKGDIVFEVSGGSRDQPVGRSVFVTDSLAKAPTIPASFCKLIRPQSRICDPKFIYYTLTSAYISRKLVQWQTQSTGIINYSFEAFLDEYEIDLPPLVTQRKIAAVLSAYDDLIENNTRRVRVLEEMARALYREWFVEYRFPGHEQAEFVEDEQGRRPKAWEWVPVAYAVELDPRTKVDKEAVNPFVPMGSLSENSMVIDPVEQRAGNSGAKFKNGDTLFARITPCLENGKTGLVNFLPDDSATAFGSTEYIVMRSRLVCPEYVYLLARLPEFRSHAEKSMSGASGRQRVRSESLSNYFIALPDKATLASFQALVKPMFAAVFNLSSRNANLRRTRDLLLPKLVSGELDVSQLEIAGVEEGQGVNEEAVA
ncbi:restriction endonuclease subunit S [Deinococcus sp. JMULE3]|uniref:restriction endonuclease subunit S n=1 Tax=Deinococcus sp. JMULE3 TaxID=2518341 RepID=UPI00157642E7|nr:restriction endonuclease subunit S [Deinococcus sp. JMULE3]NTY00456.1 restriction endonuclease subunit S [Deinococcus sp. JMULE3]